jgi:hypothetical protein
MTPRLSSPPLDESMTTRLSSPPLDIIVEAERTKAMLFPTTFSTRLVFPR